MGTIKGKLRLRITRKCKMQDLYAFTRKCRQYMNDTQTISVKAGTLNKQTKSSTVNETIIICPRQGCIFLNLNLAN